MRYVGLDWGERRIGIAISDSEGKVAMPLKAVKRELILDELEKLRAEYGNFAVVLGLPSRTDGVCGGSSEREALKLKEEIERKGFVVRLWKEWYSSAEAERLLRMGNVPSRKIRKKIDKLSAALILEAFLRGVRNESEG